MFRFRSFALFFVVSAMACSAAPEGPGTPVPDEKGHDEEGHEHEEGEGAAHSEKADGGESEVPPSGEVQLSSATRATLGITFAQVELRPVARTLRLPGKIGLRPGATAEVRPSLSGELALTVVPLQAVSAGEVLGTLTSPQLKEDKDALHTARHDVEEAEDAVRLADARRIEAERALQAVQKRIRRLEESNTRRADLDAEVDAQRRRLDLVTAERTAARAKVERERHHYSVRIAAFAARTGLSAEELLAPANPSVPDEPLWSTVTTIPIKAPRSGQISKLHRVSGWVAENDSLLEITDPEAWWFEGHALEADLPRLKGITEVQLIPSGSRNTSASVRGKLSYPAGEQDGTRRIRVVVEPSGPIEWAQVGIGAFAEVVVAGTGKMEIAVPSAAIARDGLETIVFRRLPERPDVVVRLPVDTGVDDGRFTSVLFGLTPSDEVVLDGVHTLRLSTEQSGKRVQGHVHADGSFHASDEEE